MNGGSYRQLKNKKNVLSLFPYPLELNGGSYGLTQNLKSGITGFRTLSRRHWGVLTKVDLISLT